MTVSSVLGRMATLSGRNFRKRHSNVSLALDTHRIVQVKRRYNKMNRDLIQPEMVGLSDSHREIEMLTQYQFRFKSVVHAMSKGRAERLRLRGREITFE